MMTTKKLIVVLGMHRSGTSAITRGLQVLGINLGTFLMPPALDNPKGFWEDLDVVRINEALLAEIQSSWDRVGLLDIDMAHASRAIMELKKNAQTTLANKFACVDTFAIKDPRLPRLLPFWQRIFSSIEIEVAYVIVLRNPLSVADSLAQRDKFDPVKSYQLWHEHLLTAIYYTQGQPRVVVDYDKFLSDPEITLRRITNQLQLGIINPDELKEYKEVFLDYNLRHTYYTRKDVLEAQCVPQGIRDIYPIITDCAEDIRNSDDHELIAMVTQQMGLLRGFSPVLNLLSRLDYQNQLLEEQNQRLATELEATQQSSQAQADELNAALR
ncbi:sulfotransferase family protein, partial [Acidithiobacillus caldus]|uniref:sulfotransferase family protein n=2 Tax=Acidithiobacillus caldus TaxID=33059 RepID=UPI001C0737B9